jgi:TolB protein
MSGAMRTLIVISALAAIVAAGAAEASQATFGGKNGAIAVRRYFSNDQTTGAVFTISADGTGARQVTHPPPNTLDDTPDWASDGSTLLFLRCPRNGACGVYTTRPDGTHVTRVSPPCPAGARAPKCEDDTSPSFSRDGQFIAYGSYTGGDGNAIVVVNRRGLGRRTVVARRSGVEVIDPQFSPDGKRIVFVQHNFGIAPKEGFAVFVVDVDGTGLRRLTPWTLGAGDGPDWSPDGKWILFRSDTPRVRQSQVYRIAKDGSHLTRLTLFKQGTWVGSASFSPDGRWITFSATGKGGKPDVFVMRADGKGPRPVTRTRAWDSAPDWGPAP